MQPRIETSSSIITVASSPHVKTKVSRREDVGSGKIQ